MIGLWETEGDFPPSSSFRTSGAAAKIRNPPAAAGPYPCFTAAFLRNCEAG